jgi:Sporulation and spore germination
MIPRYQRILFWILAGAILLMALVLVRGCEQAREKLTRHRDETPLAAPVATPSETVQLAMASDADGSITLVEREIALPVETTARVRALLARLIAEYSYKDSAHPIESGPAVDDVFLLDLPLRPPAAAGGRTAGQDTSGATPPRGDDLDGESHVPGAQLAVVNLDKTFADHHPSGIGAETLTIESIVGTLYTNFPRIEQVRFLVDGRPRETLNGHADLLRTYAVANTSTKSPQEVR